MKTKRVPGFQCGICNATFWKISEAHACCPEAVLVCSCGKPKNQWQKQCDHCRIINRYATSELVEDPGPWWCEEQDTIYFEIDEFLNSLGTIDSEEVLELFCTKAIVWQPFSDVDSMLEDELQEHHEDARYEVVDEEELEAFLAAWSKKQTLVSYAVDYSRKIRISKEEIDNYLKETKC